MPFVVMDLCRICWMLKWDWKSASTLQLEEWFNWSPLNIERIEPPSLIFLLIHTKFAYIFNIMFFFPNFCYAISPTKSMQFWSSHFCIGFVTNGLFITSVGPFIASFGKSMCCGVWVWCRNPNFRLATKAKELQGCGPKKSLGVASHIPESVGKCEGVNPHTPKATPTLGDGVPMESRTSESDFKSQNSMACGVLYIIGKLLERRCLKWAHITHLDIWNISYFVQVWSFVKGIFKTCHWFTKRKHNSVISNELGNIMIDDAPFCF